MLLYINLTLFGRLLGRSTWKLKHWPWTTTCCKHVRVHGRAVLVQVACTLLLHTENCNLLAHEPLISVFQLHGYSRHL